MLIETVEPFIERPRRSAEPDARLHESLARAARAAEQALRAGIGYTVAGARDSLAALTETFAAPGPALARVLDGEIDGDPAIPLRLYDPAPHKALPVCLYLHGGGHMAGSIAVYDPVCRRLAREAECRVVALDYRLAPEHPYPQGLDDCARALAGLPAWLERHGIPWPDAGCHLAGDSGGGTLAATLAARADGRPGPPVAGQILVYPSLDYSLAQPSVAENGDGYLLETSRIRWYFDNYFQAGEERRAASPLLLPLHALPPTLIVTAGFCPLRDEGYAYAQRLHAAGVPCEHLNLPGMVHAFLNLERLVPDACEAVYRAAGAFMRRT